MASFTLRASVSAPLETVFDVLTDHRGYANVTPLRSSTLEREGDPPPNGVGAIRVLGLVGPPIREEVTVYEPPTRFSYKMLSGVPIRTHTGVVELAPDGSGTSLTWHVHSTPRIPIPAAIWAAAVKPAINMLLRGVVKESERRAGESR